MSEFFPRYDYAVAFFEGSSAYNFVNLGVGILGLALAIYALVAAMLATRNAKAAATDATLAKKLVRNISAGVELTELCGYVREAVARLDAGSADAALTCLVFVQEKLARSSRLSLGTKLATPAQWRSMDSRLKEILDTLRQRCAINPFPTRFEMAPIIGSLLQIGTELARMQANAEVAASGE